MIKKLLEKDKYLLEKANLVYKFAILYNDYISEIHDYGTGPCINMVEVHTLTSIEENPSITITQLAEMWHRTKGAISQTATKLEKKELIVKKKQKDNAKNVYLYVTEQGKELSMAHKKYDITNVRETLVTLGKTCTQEEIYIFFKVLSHFINLFY
jgi:DNA-binding MarR family transcriptional regulator